MNSKIIILLGSELSSQNYKRVGIETLSKYFDLTIFDCRGLLGRNSENISHDIQHWKNYYVISTFEEFEKNLKSIRPNYALDFIGFVPQIIKIAKILNRNQIRLVLQKSGVLPVANRFRVYTNILSFSEMKPNDEIRINSVLNYAKKARANLCKTRIITMKIFKRIKQKAEIEKNILTLKFNRPYISLLSGDKALDKFTKTSKFKLWTGSNDLHTFNEVSANLKPSNLKNSKYILFIDDSVSNANDFKLLNLTPPATPEIYYPSLRKSLNTFEKFYNLPVYVAGHPNSMFDPKFSEKIGNRVHFFDRTAELTIGCEFALIHGSTAASFAVLSKKPILSLTTKQLLNSSYQLLINSLAKELGTEIINLDDPNFVDCLPMKPIINESKYGIYKSNFLISSKSSEDFAWESLIHFLAKNE